jgi:hypothetical protein
MPHVIAKLWCGKSEQQKRRLAEEITRDVTSILHYGEESVSVRWKRSSRTSGRRKCTGLNSKTIWTSFTRSPATTRVTCERTRMGVDRCKP